MIRFIKSCVQNVCLVASLENQKRLVSILYVTGDQAKENYAPLRPYMDFENTLKNIGDMIENIEHRQMSIDVTNFPEKYKKYQDELKRVEKLSEERKDIANRIKKLNSSGGSVDSEVNDLIKKGQHLKTEFKELRNKFSMTEDTFIQDFLNIPNTLHTNCPTGQNENIVYMSNLPKIVESETHLKRTDLIKFLNNSCYYLMDEAALFDVNCTHALTNHFTNSEFIHMANPDFVRRVLIEANATPVENYHVVVEHQLENKLNIAFLAGGASFESFLGAVARLRIHTNVLPLRFVSNGRIYEKVHPITESTVENLFTATQSNAVSTFVASSTADEADQHMENILNLSTEFYKELGIHFRVIYTPAYKLTSAERLRAVIEVYSPGQKRYICVGQVSNYGDYVSKRLLFHVQDKKDIRFPHIVGGPVLYTTRLIATLIENNISLDDVKLLGDYENIKLDDQIEELHLNPL